MSAERKTAYYNSANQTVLRGTFVTAGSSAFLTGIYQIFNRHTHYGQLSLYAALNTGTFALIFFSSREYLISPALISTVPLAQYARKRKEYGWAPLSTDAKLPAQTWADVRTNLVIDTWISGMLAGGLLRGLIAGRRTILPAALTSGLICSVLQLGYNELQVIRLTYIASQQNQQHINVPSTDGFVSPRILKWFGLSEYSDDEYITTLKKQRDGYIAKIQELEEQIEAGHKK